MISWRHYFVPFNPFCSLFLTLMILSQKKHSDMNFGNVIFAFSFFKVGYHVSIYLKAKSY